MSKDNVDGLDPGHTLDIAPVHQHDLYSRATQLELVLSDATVKAGLRRIGPKVGLRARMRSVVNAYGVGLLGDICDVVWLAKRYSSRSTSG